MSLVVCAKAAPAVRDWTYADDQHSNFRLLIDKETGTIFLGDHQV